MIFFLNLSHDVSLDWKKMTSSVWETSISRRNGWPIKSPPETLSRILLWWFEGFQWGSSFGAPWCRETLEAIRLIAVVFPDWHLSYLNNNHFSSSEFLLNIIIQIINYYQLLSIRQINKLIKSEISSIPILTAEYMKILNDFSY